MGLSLDTIWSPFSAASPDRLIVDRREAAEHVGSTVRASVAARTAQSRRTLLLLSGGLDSSIVAACLASAGHGFDCLNLAGDDRVSDELPYARTAANYVGARLIEQRFDQARIDIFRSGSAHMPYPVHRCFTQAQDSVAAQVAADLGADLIVDGGGGDNVFFSSRTVAILADCLRSRDGMPHLVSTAHSLGDLAQIGLIRLLCKAAHRAWLRSNRPRSVPNTTFLSGDARAIIASTPTHPWFDPPGSLPPGRASHAALLAPLQTMVEALNAQSSFPAISPLASQPVVEACLPKASWLWLAPGRDRAIARAAFEPHLPQTLIERRSKGSPTGFAAAIFEQNRPSVRACLLSGYLAASGLLNLDRLKIALAGDGPVLTLDFVQIMDLLDAEIWARAQLTASIPADVIAARA